MLSDNRKTLSRLEGASLCHPELRVRDDKGTEFGMTEGVRMTFREGTYRRTS
jgi:hypothetical protein